MQDNESSRQQAAMLTILEKIETIRPYVYRLWDARKSFVIINIVVAILCSAYFILLVKPTFQSSVDILPEFGTKSLSGGLGEIAAIAGLMGSIQNQTEIYEELVYSESVLEPVIYTKYQTKEYPDSVDLINYFEILADS